jgi:hypothetical protein
MKLKYVIFDNFFPVLFNTAIEHSSIICEGRIQTSAGFCKIEYNKDTFKYESTCSGYSVSLGINSNPKEDKQAIDLTINLR